MAWRCGCVSIDSARRVRTGWFHSLCPRSRGARDAAKATAAILAGVAHGQITPSEAAEVGRLVETHVKTLEVSDLERRITELEKRTKGDEPYDLDRRFTELVRRKKAMSHNEEKRVAKLEAAIGTSKDDPPVDSDAERKPNALDLAIAEFSAKLRPKPMQSPAEEVEREEIKGTTLRNVSRGKP
jgi:hypothetical protein